MRSLFLMMAGIGFCFMLQSMQPQKLQVYSQYFDHLPNDIQKHILLFLIEVRSLKASIKNIRLLLSTSKRYWEDSQLNIYFLKVLADTFFKHLEDEPEFRVIMAARSLATPQAIDYLRKYIEDNKVRFELAQRALFISITRNDKVGVKCLLKAGIKVPLCEARGYYSDDYHALMIALLNFDNKEMLELLLASGVSVDLPNSKGYTVLMRAAELGRLKDVEYLLQKGAFINHENTLHDTALSVTILGPKPWFIRGESGEESIFAEDRERWQERGEIIKMLLINGAHNNKPDYQGCTPLLLVARYQHSIELAKILLNAGADPAVKDSTGKTALDWAIKKNDQEMITLFSTISPMPNVLARITIDFSSRLLFGMLRFFSKDL